MSFKDISEHDLDNLSRPLIKIIPEYFKQPGVQEKFEEWLKKRELKEGEEPNDNDTTP